MSGGHVYVDRVSLGDGVDRSAIAPSGAGSLQIVTTKLYPPAAANPVAPLPVPGDRYYNTAAREWRWYDGTVWQPYGGSVAGAATPFWMGAGQVGSSPTTRYLFPDYDASLAQTTSVPVPMPRPGTLLNFFLVHTIPRGNGTLITYTVRVNGIPTALSVVLASTAPMGFDLVSAIPVNTGDFVDVEVTKPISCASSPRDVVGIMELA